MRKIYLLIFTSFLLLFPFYTKGQLSVLRDGGTGNPILANPFQEVKGSQYIADFKVGTIFLTNGQKVENLMIALNGYENTLEYKLEGNLFAYSADMLSGFSYYSESGELIEFTSEFIIPTLSKKRFLRVLEKGKYSLLAYQYILMVDDANGTYGSQSAKIFQNQLEFFIAKEGKVSLLKNKRKDLQAIFGEEAGMASSIIKDQKLNLKSEGDVKILIRQMNK